MARATWKGFLKISLVNIPIKVFPATASSDPLAFHQLHSKCQTRIVQRKWCTKCACEVPAAEIVKGFEFEKGRYVVLSDKDFEQVRPDSTRVIDLMQFADVGALEPIYLDRAYYVVPDGKRAGDAYAVICEGMIGKVGIGKVALYGREYLVAVRAQGRSLMLYTLHHAAEIRGIDDEDLVNARVATVKPAEVKLVRQVIAALFTGPAGEALSLTVYKDEYRAGLQRIIDAKIAGDEVVGPVIADSPVIGNLREALTQSLLAVSAAKKKQAKASTPAASKRKHA